MKVLDVTHPLGIRTGALWLIEGDHQYAYFVFARTAEAQHIDDLLRGRTLASVMCDGSATNNCVERAGGKRGGCNAHARRGLVEALRGGHRSPVAAAKDFYEPAPRVGVASAALATGALDAVVGRGAVAHDAG